MDVYRTVDRRGVPQAEPASAEQVPNHAGGWSFAVDDWARARRFLVLGTSAPTYYQYPPALTRDAAEAVVRCAEEDGRRLVDLVVDVSRRGLAPRQNPALFALAIASAIGGLETRTYALQHLPAVARTGTHLFLFAQYAEQFRGWGRGLARAVANWYTMRPVDDVAHQALKYRQREGWSHRDLLRLSHPRTDEPARRALFDWIAHGTAGELPRQVEGFVRAQRGEDPVTLVREYGLTWEMLPVEALDRPATWDALLDAGMPQTALLRQLPRLTRLGVLAPFGGGRTAEVCARLIDPVRLQRARVHPLAVLVASRTYASGSGRGSVWQPVRAVVDALDAAFPAAFEAVVPAGKRTLVGLDVSASMAGSRDPSGSLTAREVGAALSLVLASTEPKADVFGFTTSPERGFQRPLFEPLAITPEQRLDDAIRATGGLPFGGTDCALPMTEALRRGWQVDTFVVITDNETWAGPVHPHTALVEYRRRSGIDARLVVLAVTPTNLSIADPADPGMLDVAGFGSDVPALVNAFSSGS